MRQYTAAIFLTVLLIGPLEAQEARRFALAIHGGGGVRDRAEFEADPELERAYRAALTQALSAGHQVLAAGASAVEAVEAAILVMEDSPLFNAGKGAAFTRDGTVELDATIMNGRTMRAGGVAAVRRVRNPISLARIVMEETPHVLVVGEGAGALAHRAGVTQQFALTTRRRGCRARPPWSARRWLK